MGGIVGLYVGLWLGSRLSDAPTSDDRFALGLELLVAVIPYVWAGFLIGALLGWLAAPTLLGTAKKWPKVWLALGVQLAVGVATWLAAAFIATVADVGAGALLLVAVLILGPPAAGRWFVEHKNRQPAPTDNGSQSDSDSRP